MNEEQKSALNAFRLAQKAARVAMGTVREVAQKHALSWARTLLHESGETGEVDVRKLSLCYPLLKELRDASTWKDLPSIPFLSEVAVYVEKERTMWEAYKVCLALQVPWGEGHG